MLLKTSKKLCPLMSLILGCTSCGKKINDPEVSPTPIVSTVKPEGGPGTFTIRLEPNSIQSTFTFHRNAWIKLPLLLTAKTGTATGKRVKIFYNVSSPGDYEFQCTYRSVSSATELAFEKCENPFGQTTVSSSNDFTKFDFPMNQSSRIQMDLLNGSAPDLSISADYKVFWK